MRQEVYYQRGAPDPVLDEKTVMEIVRKHVPGAQKLMYIDESGGEARTYHVDDNIMLKVQRPQQLRMSTSLEKEAFFLRQLENVSGINVPKVYGYGRHGTIEYTCMTRMPGICVKKSGISGEKRKFMLFELGKTLRIIHGIGQKPFRECGLFPCDDPPDLTERLRIRTSQAVQAKKEVLGQDRVNKAVQFIEKELKAIKNTDIFVALHTNPAMTHTFVDTGTLQYTGLIDFGDAYIGHPVFDLRRWPVADRKMLFDGYTANTPVSPEFAIIYNTANTIDQMVEELAG